MSKSTVLIADDSEAMRDVIRLLLGEEFDIVGEASDGRAAIEAAESLVPDAIVMDISMPGMDGIEAARRLREIGCESPIVFLSDYEQQSIVRQALITPGSGYVAKSDSADELVDAIHAVVGGQRWVSHSAASVS